MQIVLYTPEIVPLFATGDAMGQEIINVTNVDQTRNLILMEAACVKTIFWDMIVLSIQEHVMKDVISDPDPTNV